MSGATTGELPGELTCRELVELVTEYLEGALAPTEVTRFELHLAACPGCTGHVHQLCATLRAAGRLSEESLPVEARTRLLRAFRDWKRRPPSGA